MLSNYACSPMILLFHAIKLDVNPPMNVDTESTYMYNGWTFFHGFICVLDRRSHLDEEFFQSSFVTARQISIKIVTMRTETILNLVFKFPVHGACFHEEEASAKSGAKVE